MKIGVIGLGLIGGSILKSLSKKGFEMYAVTRSQKTIENAAPYCVEISNDFGILKDCEVIFVAVPMVHVLQTLDKLAGYVSDETIVSDVSSLKGFVMQREFPFEFIGSHPMAGTENSGFESSFAELFEGAKWVITPREDTETENVEILAEVVEVMGATAVYADAEEHDEAVAKISHMPMLVAQALFLSAQDDELALELAASGFRDMTRLAMTNIDMACDMVNMNTPNIEMALGALEAAISDLRTHYREKIKSIAQKRAKLYDEDGKNVFKGE